jgi:DNA-binding CsgD family transcriptional regulator
MDTHDPPQSAAAIEAGLEALGRGAWEEARSAFEGADESPEVLFGLGEALWWLGGIRESVRCWEQAYTAFRRRPDPVQAANVALQLAMIYQANLGNHAAAAGWVAHAARLVDEFDLEPLQGWVLLVKATGCSDTGQSETWARQARQLAVEFGDRDLELCALSQIGVALIEQGRVGEGVPLIDEAMTGALAGEGRLDTVVFTSCLMMHSCNRCADFQRVVQWIRAADRFIERYGCPYLNATCRAHYGGVLFATGDWLNAEEELRTALELSGEAQPAVRGEALAKLAELRLAQGRIEEAERLLAGFEDHEAAAPVCARIHLLRGELALAAATIERRLGVIGESQLESALLLELLGEAEIGQGQAEAAAERGRKLAELGGTFGCRVMLAHGERLQGHALAAGADPAAKRHLDAALREFARLEMPFETARTRLLLAQALRELDPEVAEAEARAALAVFENLGASGNAGAATILLREIETKPRKQTGRPSNLAGLSRREAEVLRLVAKGLSDKEIAARLVLSRHTVHRHVSSILAKLGLPSRTAAAAYAAQHGLL